MTTFYRHGIGNEGREEKVGKIKASQKKGRENVGRWKEGSGKGMRGGVGKGYSVVAL